MITLVEKHKAELEVLCRRFGVRRLELFGSAATGKYSAEQSDLDFLVEFESPTMAGYADRYFGMLESIEELFDRPIDLVVGAAIRNPYVRAAVDRTKVLRYAA